MTHQKSKRRFQVDQEHRTEDNWATMILPLLFSLIALNLLQAKHFLVETEDKKEEDRLLDLLTDKKVSSVNAFVNAVIRDPQNAEALRKKLHQAYGDDENAVRLPLLVL